MSLRSYWELTNPNIVSLLVFTAFAAGIIGGGISDPVRLIEITVAIALCSMGARSLTNYVDRDIDILMNRTRHRPLPSGVVLPENALAYGVGLVSTGLVVSAAAGLLYSGIILFGLIDNIVVYNVLTKRRTPWNIVLGSPSGGVPAFVGYSAMTGRIDAMAFFLAAIVVLWTPVHIWSLAIHSKEDYGRANVPMLPVVVGVKAAIRCVACTSILLAIFTVALPFLPGSPFHLLTLLSSAVLAVPLLVMSAHLIKSPNEKSAWRLFKFTAPYLAILFTVMAIDVLI
jgi:protoheme IX farnesyltransferase